MSKIIKKIDNINMVSDNKYMFFDKIKKLKNNMFYYF